MCGSKATLEDPTESLDWGKDHSTIEQPGKDVVHYAEALGFVLGGRRFSTVCSEQPARYWTMERYLVDGGEICAILDRIGLKLSTMIRDGVQKGVVKRDGLRVAMGGPRLFSLSACTMGGLR